MTGTGIDELGTVDEAERDDEGTPVTIGIELAPVPMGAVLSEQYVLSQPLYWAVSFAAQDWAIQPETMPLVGCRQSALLDVK